MSADFYCAHATAADPLTCVDAALTRLPVRDPAAARLGIAYATEACAERIGEVLTRLRTALPAVQWSGSIAHGVIGRGFESDGGCAIALLVTDFAPGRWALFSDSRPIGFDAHGALVHADPRAGDIAELLRETAARVRGGDCFGGVGAAGPTRGAQIAGHVVAGGLSGVAFDASVRRLSRVTQGCAPIAGEHVVSSCSAHYIESIDGEPALDVLLADLGVPADARASRDGDEILRAMPLERLRAGLLVGLSDARLRRTPGFGDFLVRNLVGIDPRHRVLAVAATPAKGERLVFCTRSREAARADLVRVCTELREEIEADALVIGAVHYVSCVARGEALFGAPGVEAGIIAHHLGDPPLVGLFANGEFRGDRLYAYSGVLTVFVDRT